MRRKGGVFGIENTPKVLRNVVKGKAPAQWVPVTNSYGNYEWGLQSLSTKRLLNQSEYSLYDAPPKPDDSMLTEMENAEIQDSKRRKTAGKSTLRRKKGGALFYRLPAEWRPVPGYQYDGYDETISGPVPFSWALFSQKTGRRLNIRSGDKGRYYINYPVKNTKADDVVDKLPEVYCTRDIPNFKIFDQADFDRILQLCPPKTAEQRAIEKAAYQEKLNKEKEKRNQRLAATQ
jgi:hypothetical protein